MTNFTSVVAYLVKKTWLLLAILLVVFALVLSAARYALPHIEHNKHLLEDYINQRYGVNLTIESVHAVWQRTGPSIVLNTVSLAQDSASPVGLKIRQVYVELDFWQSITQRMISSTRFELRGLNVHIDADRFERAGETEFPVIDALNGLFLEQLQSFSLEEGEVVLTHNNDTESFKIDRLSWNNRDDRHQGTGQIRVEDLASNSASFIIDITGDKESFDGVFYAQAEKLDISPWVGDLLKTKRPLTQSRANFEVWADFTSKSVDGIQARFDNSLLEWGGDEYSSMITGVEGGNIQAFPTSDGWSIRVDKLIVNSNNETLVTDLVGKVTDSGDLLFNTVKPVQLNPFLMLLPLAMDDTSEDEVRLLNPSGQLATLQVQVIDGEPEVAAKVLDLSWFQSEKAPGLSALDADVFWHKDAGAVYLHSKNSLLSADKIIKQNLAINEFNADLYVHSKTKGSEKQWVVTGKNILFDSEQVVIHPELSINLSSGDIDFYTNIDPVALNSVSQFFPVSKMGKNTDSFLTRAFAGSGEVSRARLLWHGNPKHFPFDDNSGVFQAYIDIQDSEFVFSSRWPALTELDLSVYFQNKGLTIQSESGRLANVDVSDMSASIPSLHPSSTLTITANGAGTGEALTELAKQSSVSKSLGKILDKDVNVSGPLSANLTLDIPLKGKNIRVRGEATLQNNPVYVSSTKMRFNNTSGKLRFDNQKIDAQELTAELLAQPVTIELHGQQDDNYNLNVNLAGRWHVHPLVKYIKTDLVDYIDGEADWQADIDVELSNSAFSYTAQIDADLTDTQSTLPAPFYSLNGSEMPLTIFSEGNLQASTINASLGDEVRFEGVLPHKEMQFSRAHLSLGAAELDNRGTGFSIAANLEQADVVEWFSTLKLIIKDSKKSLSAARMQSGGSVKANLFGTPSRVVVTTDSLSFWDHTLKNVTLTAREQDKDWLLQVDSAEARATIRINSDLEAQGIEVNADYLSLDKVSKLTGESADEPLQSDLTQVRHNKGQLDPLDLPPIYFYCRVCNIYDINLGEVTVDATKTDNGMYIRQLLLKSSDAELSATGYWEHNDEQLTTRFEGKVFSADVGQMLKQYGITSGIKDSQANVTFDLGWSSSPFEFSPTTLNGDIDWEFSDGYLTEVSDKGSRIFTLFSLNSLVRKLSLDFRDVFATGFFYDKMGGSLQIADGQAFTDDTEIDGGAGEIEIKGITNLNTGGLNYNISFAPNVTGNLPFLVYFLATPPTALAALALDQVLTSAKVISNVNYKVTGTLSDPHFDEMGRDSKDISLPTKATPTDNSLEDRPLSEDDLHRVQMEIIDG